MRVFFFFQAEDGMRDLVRSRGLGDVYKRQRLVAVHAERLRLGDDGRRGVHARDARRSQRELRAVSYTHLTLPTSDLV